ASFVCIAQNSVHDNTSLAQRTGSGTLTCIVICEDEDDEDYEGIRIAMYTEDSTGEIDEVPTSGYELLINQSKKNISTTANGENNTAKTNKGYKTLSSAPVMNLITNRSGREADCDADGLAEDFKSVLMYYLEKENKFVLNKDFVKFEVKIKYSYDQM
ncbi:MAG: hypothetical protein HZB41_14065, partial [Ignavibacteriae bacterium]|nr:hypothetical protein [Ignavibacteriota bacterium]